MRNSCGMNILLRYPTCEWAVELAEHGAVLQEARSSCPRIIYNQSGFQSAVEFRPLRVASSIL